ncbi:hypothetical protein Ciccas_009371 [Cichlidogyrus casuarinus]|uniref:Uncharacterized protein n=1 Tax=Cichlidogyrus casuarinus TaxID=1844966 RepID=A0ABD2PYZ0_9PLAT
MSDKTRIKNLYLVARQCRYPCTCETDYCKLMDDMDVFRIDFITAVDQLADIQFDTYWQVQKGGNVCNKTATKNAALDALEERFDYFNNSLKPIYTNMYQVHLALRLAACMVNSIVHGNLIANPKELAENLKCAEKVFYPPKQKP